MNYEYALGQCTNYLLDILDVPPGELPDRAQEHWSDLFRLAADQRIYHYLAAWMLEYWKDALPEKVKHRLWMDLEWNRARNIKLTQEIVELAKMFNEAGIPAMFLKGAAGLVRGLYPPGWRYISDIDVMVREEDTERTEIALKSSGFTKPESKLHKRPHHLAPYYYLNNISGIEIHTKPYNYCFKNYIVGEIWNNSEKVMFHLEPITIPSFTDHVWILLRKDLINKIMDPRFGEYLEIMIAIKDGYRIDKERIEKRAVYERLPNLVNNASFYVLKDFGNICGKTVSHDLYKKFKRESNHFINIKRNEKTFFMHLKKFCLSVKYLSGPGISDKVHTAYNLLCSYNTIGFIKLALPRIGHKNLIYRFLQKVERSWEPKDQTRKSYLKRFCKIMMRY